MGLTAKDVMTTDLVTVTPATPVSEFARICMEDKITGCPVVTVDGRLVGIVSRSDLLSRLLEGGHNYAANPDYRRFLALGEEGVYGLAGSAAESEEELLGDVDEIMQQDVVTFEPDTPVTDVAKRMAADRIHRVLVVEGGKLEGIITSLDLLAHFAIAGD